MKRKIRITAVVIAAIIMAIITNECAFVFFGQDRCAEKIAKGEDLNCYETFCAYTLHTGLWMFGWIVEPNTAEVAFCKQFHIRKYPHLFRFPADDEYLSRTKGSLGAGQSRRLVWRLNQLNYVSRASILLNGATITYIKKDEMSEIYRYDNPMDYANCKIHIHGIPLYEGLFDYLERKGIIAELADVRYVEYRDEEIDDITL